MAAAGAGGVAEGANEKGAGAVPLVLGAGAPKAGTAGVIEAVVGLKLKPPKAGAGAAGVEAELSAGLGAARAANGLAAGAPKGEPDAAGAPKPPKAGAFCKKRRELGQLWEGQA